MAVERVTVSSDVGGIRADPREVQTLYEQAGFVCGIELVAMPAQYSLIKKLSRGHYVGFTLDGIHGQLGVSGIHDNPKGLVDGLKSMAAEKLLPQVTGFTKKFPILPFGLRVDMIGCLLDKLIYLNVHNDAVKKDLPEYLVYAKFAMFSRLTIENGLNSADVAETTGLIKRFRDDGCQETTGTFDLVHAVIAHSGHSADYPVVVRYWSRILEEITDDFSYLHLPIGVNDDSLPIAGMLEEKMMLSDLAAVITERSLQVILENQHHLAFGADFKNERERLLKIKDAFIKCGLYSADTG